MQRPDGSAWLVDLRGNGGGNMYPMIAGIAPLLPPGDLYRFLDGHRVPTATVAIADDGVHLNGHTAFATTTDVGRLARGPVIVVFGPRCTSSCEQVANALSARARTLFVGAPTGGYLSTNTLFPLNADYVLLLTEGYTATPCGPPTGERLLPDVSVEAVDSMSVEALLALPAVADWLERTRALAAEPVSAKERSARCDKSTNTALARTR